MLDSRFSLGRAIKVALRTSVEHSLVTGYTSMSRDINFNIDLQRLNSI